MFQTKEIENIKNNSKKLVTAKNDRVFKAIMLNNLDILASIVSQAMGEEVEVLDIINPELPVRNTNEKCKTVDVLIKTKNNLKINLELNTSNDLATRVRNMHFFTSFYSQQSKRGKDYDTVTQFVQINLNYNAPDYEDIIEKYSLRSESGKVREVNFTIIDVNMDKLMEMCYHKPEELEKYRYLHMLNIEDLEELEKISRDDKIMEKYTKELEELNSDPEFVWDYEEDAMRLHNTQVRLAKEEGLKEGVEEGEKNKAIETAKNLLTLGTVSAEDIAKATGLDLKEVENLKKNA